MPNATTDEHFEGLEEENEETFRRLARLEARADELQALADEVRELSGLRVAPTELDDIARGYQHPVTLAAVGEIEQALAGAIVALTRRVDRLERRGSRGRVVACSSRRCSWARRTGHDELIDMLAAETPGAAERLLRTVLTWDELTHEADAISPVDWPDFASEHAWPDPASSKWLAVFARDIHRMEAGSAAS